MSEPSMRIAFADPLYLGLAEKFYGDPTYDRIEAHPLTHPRPADGGAHHDGGGEG